MADQIDAALHLIDDRADQLEDARADASPADAALPPASAARHRLIVAAMHYLSRHSRPRAADSEAKDSDTDTLVVIAEVLGSAQADLEPYLEEPDAEVDEEVEGDIS